MKSICIPDVFYITKEDLPLLPQFMTDVHISC